MLTTFLPLALAAVPATAAEVPAQAKPKPSIVLVHGAFADGSCWLKVIGLLQKKGYDVTAVQNPLTGYADDVATTKRVIDVQKGPVVLVGHSYGGAVISGAATDKVKALVYIAAFAPDEGEVIGGLLQKYPSPLGTALVPDSAGFVIIDPLKYHDVFTADLPKDEAQTYAVSQGPIKGEILGTPMGSPAWKKIPSWFLVAQEDRAINPDLERFFAKRMNAKTTELKSSHVPFLSHPDAVVKMIEEAATAVAKS